MSARLAGKRILQAVFFVLAIAGAGSAFASPLDGLIIFVVGFAGFIGASFIPEKA